MNSNISIINKPSIENVKGYYSNGINCGIKKSEKLDLGVVFSTIPAKTFAMYTNNKIQGAPLKVCQKHLRDNKAQLLVVNSIIANACTGEQGIKNSKEICNKAALSFGLKQNDIIPMSTGVIGEHVPTNKIIKGIADLKNKIKEKNLNNFSNAIMTTDTYPKIIGVKIKLDGVEYKIVGTAKGSGMIHPNMATMLSFIFTDVNIKKKLLKKAFNDSIQKSFNSVTVDGDTSTNDTAIIFANGLAKNESIKKRKSMNYKIFCEALDFITTELAKQIIKDGEGATKFIEINVKEAPTFKDAKLVGMSVANSNLVKTAFFGNDDNWGRIICAIGYSNANFNPDKITLSIGDIELYSNGKKTSFFEKDVKNILQNREIKVNIGLNCGNKSWTVWTTDLSYDYVKINANYRT